MPSFNFNNTFFTSVAPCLNFSYTTDITSTITAQNLAAGGFTSAVSTVSTFAFIAGPTGVPALAPRVYITYSTEGFQRLLQGQEVSNYVGYQLQTFYWFDRSVLPNSINVMTIAINTSGGVLALPQISIRTDFFLADPNTVVTP